MTEFWAEPVDALVLRLETDADRGLTDAAERLRRFGPNRLRPPRTSEPREILLGQFRSPILLLLIAAALVAAVVGDISDAVIILTLVLASALLGFWQEYRAAEAVLELGRLVHVTATVVRGGAQSEVPLEEVVPGDVVVLAAGDSVPGDARLLEARDLFVDEASLTGESSPAGKEVGTLAAELPLARRTNALFQGTHVVSGTGRAVVVATGLSTVLGSMAEKIAHRPPETGFERGVRRFGYLLLQITFVLAVLIFAVNVALGRNLLDSLLFGLALAVGLTPELLPAIVGVTLARGARIMARSNVIVKRLVSIENFGGAEILCSDKTGTLTEGRLRVHSSTGHDGTDRPRALELARVNAALESGFRNPIDEAIRTSGPPPEAWKKVDELPYDFVRKRLSVLADGPDGRVLVTKGAVDAVLEVCSSVELQDGGDRPLSELRGKVDARFRALSEEGLRCIAVAFRPLDGRDQIAREDEAGLTLLGLVAFLDPPKPDAAAELEALRRSGIDLKVVSGDNRHVTASVARQVGIGEGPVITGPRMRTMSDTALARQAATCRVFAEIEPNQKERLLRALQAAGKTVAFLGDGINDAAALHTADVGISVDTAADVTRSAADIVLLEKDLGVLEVGVRQGRQAFANTLKYVFITASANFGNMLSMAVASLFTGFLPMLPKQILLLNLLTDLPAMGISTDRLDPDLVRTPRHWDIGVVRRFMVIFGSVSSVFDFLTFGSLLFLGVGAAAFRTAWFMESLLSEILVLMIIRTRGPVFRSRPGRALEISSLVVAGGSVALPYTPLAPLLGFAPLTLPLLLLVGGITAAYGVASEATKLVFFRKAGR